jgi:hypothetical protein
MTNDHEQLVQLERIFEEVIVASFKVLHCNLLGWSKKESHENIRVTSVPCQGSNHVSPKCQSEVFMLNQFAWYQQYIYCYFSEKHS